MEIGKISKSVLIACLINLFVTIDAMQCISDGFTEAQCKMIKNGKKMIDKKWKEVNLSENSRPYINSQMRKYKESHSYMDGNFDIVVLNELATYIDYLRSSLVQTQ